METTWQASRMSRRSLLLVGAGVAVTGVAACTSTDEPQAGDVSPGPTEDPATAKTSDEATADGDVQTSPGDEYTTTVATSIVASLSVHAAPDDKDALAAGAEQMVLNRADEVSGNVVVLVLEEGAAWLKVQLPVRPNGTSGWIRAQDVRTSQHRYAIDITLSGFELVLTQGASEVLRTPIGVGRTDRPTPGGDYYIKELLSPPDPNGLYGPYAYGLSGFSNVLTEFAGGEGVIGIHGTNEPDLIGSDVSSGCIRMPNETVTRLVEDIGLPLGTPVTIRA